MKAKTHSGYSRLTFPTTALVAPVIALVGTAMTLHAADYTVATSGSESNPGTLAEPFATIQQAADIMVAGDTCTIREGVYRETSLMTIF